MCLLFVLLWIGRPQRSGHSQAAIRRGHRAGRVPGGHRRQPERYDAAVCAGGARGERRLVCFLLCTIACVRYAVVLTICAKNTLCLVVLTMTVAMGSVPEVAPYCDVYACIVHIATGAMDAAKEVLRVTFEQNPSGATFSMFQRFIRRTLGIAAARRMFSETHSMRANNPKLSLEVREGLCNDLLSQQTTRSTMTIRTYHIYRIYRFF
jgi:hypothetical protein